MEGTILLHSVRELWRSLNHNSGWRSPVGGSSIKILPRRPLNGPSSNQKFAGRMIRVNRPSSRLIYQRIVLPGRPIHMQLQKKCESSFWEG